MVLASISVKRSVSRNGLARSARAGRGDVRRLIVAAVELAVEVQRLDDQRVSLPAPAAVAQPLADGAGGVGTPVQRHDARLVDHLHHQHEVAGRLEDLVVGVVQRRNHRGRQGARDAPLPVVAVAPRIGLAAAGPRVLAVDKALHPLLGHPDAPVGRVDDQRLALDVPRLLQPARAGAPRRRNDRLPRLPTQGLLLARQALERRRRRVVPDPLEVRSAPGCTRQLGAVFRRRGGPASTGRRPGSSKPQLAKKVKEPGGAERDERVLCILAILQIHGQYRPPGAPRCRLPDQQGPAAPGEVGSAGFRPAKRGLPDRHAHRCDCSSRDYDRLVLARRRELARTPDPSPSGAGDRRSTRI